MDGQVKQLVAGLLYSLFIINMKYFYQQFDKQGNCMGWGKYALVGWKI